MTENETRPPRIRQNPTVQEILAARTAAKLNQEEAARIVHLGSAIRWSEYERGVRKMDAMRFELFLIKTGQHMEYGPIRGRFARRVTSPGKSDTPSRTA